jgi:hypothetical protein
MAVVYFKHNIVLFESVYNKMCVGVRVEAQEDSVILFNHGSKENQFGFVQLPIIFPFVFYEYYS